MSRTPAGNQSRADVNGPDMNVLDQGKVTVQT
jgi:hypothetical protein